MNLVVDFGNTCIKTALFNQNDLLEHKIHNDLDELIITISSNSQINNCIISSVTNQHLFFFERFSSKFNILIIDTNTPLPIKNLYKSPLSLGSDRLAASVGSFYFYPGRNVLTIDIGTCVKYNFVTANNCFIGGAISPGIQMRLKAMHNYTWGLPLLKIDNNYQKLVGETTNESLLSGAMLGALFEIKATIQEYSFIYDNLQLVFTGGDSEYLCKQLKNPFFANQNILLYGLNTILNFNVQK